MAGKFGGELVPVLTTRHQYGTTYEDIVKTLSDAGFTGIDIDWLKSYLGLEEGTKELFDFNKTLNQNNQAGRISMNNLMNEYKYQQNKNRKNQWIGFTDRMRNQVIQQNKGVAQ